FSSFSSFLPFSILLFILFLILSSFFSRNTSTVLEELPEQEKRDAPFSSSFLLNWDSFAISSRLKSPSMSMISLQTRWPISSLRYTFLSFLLFPPLLVLFHTLHLFIFSLL